MFLTKTNKKKFIDYLEKLCINTGLSIPSLGILIRVYHCSAPLVLYIFVVLGNKILVQMTISYIIFLVILWFLFDGCFLSMLENRMCDDKWNLVDPILEITDIPITYESRKNVSHYICFCYMIVVFGTYAIRFINI